MVQTRKMLTEILLEVTNSEIERICTKMLVQAKEDRENEGHRAMISDYTDNKHSAKLSRGQGYKKKGKYFLWFKSEE